MWWKKKSKKKYMRMLNIIFVFISALFLSCSINPEPINYGKDQCEHCKMTIMDNKFGAELITDKGKIFKFDAAECMIHFIHAGKVNDNEISELLVTNASKPGEFIDAKKASYLISENFPSPMGAGLSAYASQSDAESFREKYQGFIINWDRVFDRLQPKTQ